MVKYCIQYVLDNAPEEMKFFEQRIDKECIKRITHVRDSHFERMTYTKAIEYLEEAIANGVKFENKVYWGMDLNAEHEKYICEEIVKGPVFLTDYPKDIKAFYMRLNDDKKTVAACDLLVPGIGELVGGSQREERYDVLEAMMKEKNMTTDTLQWYMDLRRFGGCKHAGFGLGFDRFLMYLTGMGNIRDTEPFPRTPRNLKF
jgi:asparaginyl-tRNA synthetase